MQDTADTRERESAPKIKVRGGETIISHKSEHSTLLSVSVSFFVFVIISID
jgi:hypothetical protein